MATKPSSALEHLLLAYAKLFARNLPRSATHEIPELRPMELKLCELLDDTDWYCDKWPGRPLVIFFCDLDDGRGTDSQYVVDLSDETVGKYNGPRKSHGKKT